MTNRRSGIGRRGFFALAGSLFLDSVIQPPLWARTGSANVSEIEDQIRGVYCLRKETIYEIPSVRQDGTVFMQPLSITSHGTGYVYAQDELHLYIATNHHVAVSKVIEVAPSSRDLSISYKKAAERLFIVDDAKDRYDLDNVEATVVNADIEGDMAVLKVRKDSLKGKKIEVSDIPFGSLDEVSLDQQIFIKGFPKGIGPLYTEGKVSMRQERTMYGVYDSLDFIIQSTVDPGHSGSPIFYISKATNRLKVLGFIHAAIGGSENIKLARPIDQVSPLLELRENWVPTQRQIVYDEKLTTNEYHHIRMEIMQQQSPLDNTFIFQNRIVSLKMQGDRLQTFFYLAPLMPTGSRQVRMDDKLSYLSFESESDLGAIGKVVYQDPEKGYAEFVFSQVKADDQKQLSELYRTLHRAYHDHMQINALSLSSKTSKEGAEMLRRHVARVDERDRISQVLVSSIPYAFSKSIESNGGFRSLAERYAK